MYSDYSFSLRLQRLDPQPVRQLLAGLDLVLVVVDGDGGAGGAGGGVGALHVAGDLDLFCYLHGIV